MILITKLEQTSWYQYVNWPLMLFSQAWWRGPGKAVWQQAREHADRVTSVSATSAWHFGKMRSLTLLSLSGSRRSGSDSQFVILSSLWLRPCLFCALRSAIQSQGRVSNTVWFLLSTDCSWNVPRLSGNRLVLRLQHADAREFPSAHLPKQWAGLCVSPALGTTAKLDRGWVPAVSACTANWERR